jgi:hypothetical protein
MIPALAAMMNQCVTVYGEVAVEDGESERVEFVVDGDAKSPRVGGVCLGSMVRL